jgi:nucleoside-diphosphate-sugar epimerase
MTITRSCASDLRHASCLVTGGLGFIGSNLALTLAEAGARVTVVDALIEGHGGDRRNLAGASVDIDVVVADIGDAAAVGPHLRGADVVFNVAGQVSHVASMVDPLRDLDLNARSHLAFLELVRAARPDAAVVHTSTRQVYGRPRYLPVDEEHPTEPVDVNGIDKLAAEQFHMLYGAVHGLRTTALRLTNVYGPRQCLSKDGLGFLPSFIRRALRGEPIEVFGDGEQRRDCLHVDDVVDALVAAAVTPESAGEIFNLGHPDAHGLGVIARLAADSAAAGSEVRYVPWPEHLARIDIGSFQGDCSKAKRILSWTPQIDVGEGLPATLAFYRGHPWYLSST